MPQNTAVLLMGPTGAGKSALAEELAQRFDAEIVSVDSALVYRGMDIGTAKPPAATRARIPHHLIDIREPTASYSAGEFTRDALAAVQGIWARGRLPLLVGGTMLYFHALTEGIAPLPAADPALRAELDAEGVSRGWAALHAELAGIDPAAAKRIHAHDPQRIQRALEVYRLTGKSITTLQQQRVSAFADVNVIEFAIAPLERSVLHTRISERFRAMLAAGLVDEVRRLQERGDLRTEHPSMRAVGYRQLWAHVAGQITLNEASEQAVAATRQLAKRQLTWLRRRQHAQRLNSMHREVARMAADALEKCGVNSRANSP
jgi:tRNA dimethylallyltransferase